jgi:alpha-tubulin suppressor-like RCC1 family protein
MRVRIVAAFATLATVTSCSSVTEPDGNRLRFQKLTLGLQRTCGLTTEGKAYCWGESGLLGIGSNGGEMHRPVAVAGDRRYFDIVTGTGLTCGLDAVDSTAWCWGRDEKGVTFSVPTQLSSEKLAALSIGLQEGNYCGLNPAGEVRCWGANAQGQVGNGTLVAVTTPTLVGSVPPAALVVAGYHTCMLTTAGAAHCWGADIRGQVGRSMVPPTCEPFANCLVTTPTAVIGNHTFTSITVGGSHTCALNASNEAFCWGNSQHGQVGAEPHLTRCIANVPCNPSPTKVPGLTFARIVAGSMTTCAVTTAGKGYCWGYNEEAQAGNGTLTVDVREPSAVASDITFRVIYPGTRHTCGIATDDLAYCWGNNIAGSLGIGGNPGRYTSPRPVASPLQLDAP